MSRVEIERQLRWLMILRIVTVTTLLISAFAIELLARPGQSLRPLFGLAGAAYGLALLYATLDRWLLGSRAFVYLQLVGDALLVSWFVGITGGLDSPMSFLYLLPIGVASLFEYRRGGLSLAVISWSLYTALVLFGARNLPGGWILGAPLEREPGRVGYFLVVHLVGFVAVALLCSYLSERVRTQGRELDERRGAVARLQALNENIIESIHSGLVTTDLAGRIRFMNRGGVEITGYSAEEVDGRNVRELFSLEEGALSETRALALAKRRVRFERRFQRRDGYEIYLGVALSSLQDRSGAPLGYIFIFQDLTEIHALEQEVRLKERMAALGEMAAGMAHELRNPLAAISGAVQYLKGDLRPGGETLELMDIILRESQRLDQAIRDFLMFARPGIFAPQRSDLVRLLEENLKLLRKSAEFRPSHRVETRFGSDELWCDIDPNRMKQVFWNLATNALKAMPDGGTLTIEAAAAPGGDRVEICFADEGIGMDERALEGYFQPFRSSFAEGTGLGAAIVYRLVEEHGGKIALESGPGEGTRVRIQLPRSRKDGARAAESQSIETPAVGGRRR
jgi:two-component system sensor histidine kinase PilS (NtrC family)